MPSYFYHLKFELYPTPNPTISPQRPTQGSTAASNIWLPPPDTDIFGELPSHPPRNTRTSRTGRPQPSPIQSSYDTAYRPSHTAQKRASDDNEEPGLHVIDCGLSRAPVKADNGKDVEVLTARQWKARTQSFPPPPAFAAIRPDAAVQDWRFGRVSVESLEQQTTNNSATDMDEAAGSSGERPSAATGIGPMFGGAGSMTMAKLLPLDTTNTELGWGVVHFYREQDDSPSLRRPITEQQTGKDGDCTTVCVPAVPSYWSFHDLLGFIGEEWKESISHYRLVTTAQMNRYLVLMKFRDGQKARAWQKEFDGKLFNNIEAQVCQAIFIRSITFETPTRPDGAFPDLSRDPFTPSSAVSNTLKPFPPPTPNLIELPTCAVCLERMDDTTGLMTISCQHVFHCKCLDHWQGSGCPVCRHTSSKPAYDPSNPYTQPFGSSVSNLCSVCDTADDIWICLICGKVGCGRYKGGHAKDHWKETAHSFALEMETQYVWDYAGDTWVHRLIRDKGDGKVVELPGTTSQQAGLSNNGDGSGQQDDVVPRAKLDNVGMEYTHLLTSQLESQRVYFEEMVSKIADKAAKATSTADAALQQSKATTSENKQLRAELDKLRLETVPQLERDAERDRKKAEKAQDLARSLGKALQEEKEVGKGLMKRVEHNQAEVEALRARDAEQKEKIAELEEMNRDLSMFISGQEKLKEMEAEGQVEAGELAEGSASVPEKKGRRKGKR
ncbi:hypothetical protein VD0004_g4269 [Verticillium dahliae]|uniref:RING finger protein n=1 Tax=Verticillium dahliae TaxID=27337 RepID=A0A444RXQ1_VERDA|nr:hypothetical protein VD0004_g4269 [Verticillium dahliae]PNH64945.1 hypothetical protein VD0001_g8663 [Verticillium dahliae]RXG45903.1 hypothetical protein VDGE_05594 [Verticillium dahliae]